MWQTSEEEHKSAGHASKFHQHDHAESLFVLAENEGLCFSGNGGCLDPNSMAPFLPKHDLSPCFLCQGGQEEYHIYNIYRCICVHAYLSVCVHAYVYIYVYKYTVRLYIQTYKYTEQLCDLTELHSAAALFGKPSPQIHLCWYVYSEILSTA